MSLPALNRKVTDARHGVAALQNSDDPVPVDPRSASAPRLRRVAILLCTCQGQNFLAAQLDSIASQTHRNWKVWASDDHSTDGTISILKNHQAKWEDDRLSIRRGPGKGFVANFLSLTCDGAIKADYYAYADQDDVWEPDKITRALTWLDTVPPGVPALYCSRTILVDAENNPIGLSALFTKPPTFANALIQNIAGGNTMVFNGAARDLLCLAGPDVDMSAHDWWAYIVVSGCGGRVFYDSHPSVRYRQHGGNRVGMDLSWSTKLTNLRRLWQGRLKYSNSRNASSILPLRSRLTPENQKVLDHFLTARNLSLIPRLIGLKRAGIYRQSALGNLGVIAAAFFNKV